MSTLYTPSRPSLTAVVRDLLTRTRRLEAMPARAVYEIKLFADEVWADSVSVVTVGDNRFKLLVDEDLNGAYLLNVQGMLSVVGTGATTVQVRNRGNGAGAGVDMLSTPLTIDSGTLRSCDSATPVVINPLTDQVAGCDVIALDIDSAGAGAKGLCVIVTLGGF